MASNTEFKKAIGDHLESIAATDPLFAETFKKANKNLDDCVTYIMNTVRKSGRSVVPDGEIFGMAMHYYDEDTIDIGGPVHDKSTASTAKAETKKAAPAPAKKKEVKPVASLFD